MDQHDTEFDHHAHPVGPEIDDTINPTAASPEEASASTASGAPGADSPSGDPQAGRPRSTAGREMLIQLQQMIDTVAVQAAPVMREVAAKAAELAAIAAERAGPVAHRAAEVTETVGGRVAARSKEFAADLRRTHGEEATPEASQPAEPGAPADPAPSTEPAPPADGPEDSAEQY
jgi:hypothetical protein